MVYFLDLNIQFDKLSIKVKIRINGKKIQLLKQLHYDDLNDKKLLFNFNSLTHLTRRK